MNYGEAILSGFEYLLDNYKETFIIGQGLWSPWYVGNSMTDLDKKYGIDRIIDTPVSESACTGAAVGASIAGMRPIVVHPRIDFMLYAMDSIVNQAAKWSYMYGGQAKAPVTIRGIINRGGEQGAQHSQALQSWFSHIPGLRVVMPSTVSDARDLLISSVICDDPVIFIDDRWLYDQEDNLTDIVEFDLKDQSPQIVVPGDDLTIVTSGYSTYLAKKSLMYLNNFGINPEIIDLRILNPINYKSILKSVSKTGNLLVVDGGWSSCGIASEVIASVFEKINPNCFKNSPIRITLPNCPAPTPKNLERIYYPDLETIIKASKTLVNS